mmetsp:Transcript_18322/g.23389  ORF Transcript_18322/g.23389 Transcript_18322/m.23389 type:complete len:523 (-) Transcript_18322:93-1661(-)
METVKKWVYPDKPVQEPIKFDENGNPVVYRRRFHVLTVYCLGYFLWNWQDSRQVILASEYAEYFDTTTSFEPKQGELGVDFIKISASVYYIILYPIAGYLIDNYGIKLMLVAALLQVVGCWWWYLSFTAYYSVLVARLWSAIGGTLNASALLVMVNSWFPAKERPLAVGLGVLLANIGAGTSLIMGPLFATDDRIVNIDLKSCKPIFSTTFNTSGSSECTDEAQDNFCCFTPTAIDFYNLILAILASIIFIYAVFAFRELPPTPPSIIAVQKKGPGFLQALKLMFSKGNYAQICLADFLSSGPPLVFFATIDRILPASIAEYDFYAAAGGIALSFPAAALFGRYIAKHKTYYSTTAFLYVTGFLFWAAATICYAVGTSGSEFAVLVLGVGALVTFIVWSIGVYELKLEYTYSKEYNLGGAVVGVDRTIINSASLVYVAAIPPERFDIDGRTKTMYIGLASMAIGTLLVLTVRNKYRYLRQEHENELESIATESVPGKEQPLSFENLDETLEEIVDGSKTASI